MKKWEAPKLIVIVRSSPEESLISACKGGNTFEGPRAVNTACYFPSDGCLSCAQYSTS